MYFCLAILCGVDSLDMIDKSLISALKALAYSYLMLLPG